MIVYMQSSNVFVVGISNAVAWIYGQKIYTLCFLLFMMFYNLFSKFIYVPIGDILCVLNSKTIMNCSDARLKKAHVVCLKMMNVSKIMMLISYIIRLVIILIFVGVFFVNAKMFAFLININLLLTIIQSTMTSMIYFIERKVGKLMNIGFGIKLSMFFSNIIGMIFQIIFICRILNPNSHTVFHTIVLMIYCGCINYLLMNQLYLSTILTVFNVLLSVVISFVLFWDYFIVNNYGNYTYVNQILVMTFFFFVSILCPIIIFIITRYLCANNPCIH